MAVFSTRLRLLMLACFFILLSTADSQAQKTLDDGVGAFATGKYRNLFEEDGHSKREIKAKIDSAYRQLFHGDPQTQAIAFAAGSNANGPLMYVTDWANHDVRTEGMSYGMTITVELGKKAEFDAIWNWAKTYMYISDPKAPSYEFFAWSCKTDGTHNSEGAAPDGESYFAMALLFASNRWGDGEGIYDYHAEAEKLLTAMVHRPVITAPGKYGPHSVGPMMNPDPPMISVCVGVSCRSRSPILRITCRRFMNCGRDGVRWRIGSSGREQRRRAEHFSRRPRIRKRGLRRVMRTSMARRM